MAEVCKSLVETGECGSESVRNDFASARRVCADAWQGGVTHGYARRHGLNIADELGGRKRRFRNKLNQLFVKKPGNWGPSPTPVDSSKVVCGCVASFSTRGTGAGSHRLGLYVMVESKKSPES